MSGEKKDQLLTPKTLPDPYKKYGDLEDLTYVQCLLPRDDSVVIETGDDPVDPKYRRYEFHPSSGTLRTYFWHDGRAVWAGIDLCSGSCQWSGGTIHEETDPIILHVLRDTVSAVKDSGHHEDLLELCDQDTLDRILESGRSMTRYGFKKADAIISAIIDTRNPTQFTECVKGEYYLVDNGYAMFVLQLDKPVEDGSDQILEARPSKYLMGQATIGFFRAGGNQTSHVFSDRFSPGKVELQQRIFRGIYHISRNEAKRIAQCYPPDFDLTFPVPKEEIQSRIALYALEALQFSRWHDFNRNPESEEVITREQYKQAMQILTHRFGIDQMVRAVIELGTNHFYTLDSKYLNRQLHSDITPYSTKQMSIGRELLGTALIHETTMEDYGHPVNVATLFGDPHFWDAIVSMAEEGEHELVNAVIDLFRQYEDPNISGFKQGNMYGKKGKAAHPIGVMRDYFKPAFARLCAVCPELASYTGPAFVDMKTEE